MKELFKGLERELEMIKEHIMTIETDLEFYEMYEKKIEKELAAKDSLITSYKVAGAKLFHENEKLKKRVKELEG